MQSELCSPGERKLNMKLILPTQAAWKILPLPAFFCKTLGKLQQLLFLFTQNTITGALLYNTII